MVSDISIYMNLHLCLKEPQPTPLLVYSAEEIVR